MPIALNINATKRYVLEADRKLPQEHQTIFILGNLPLEERIKIEDEQAQYGVSTDKNPEAKADMTIKQHKRNLEIVKLGLVGFENFKDGDGKDVLFETVAMPGGRAGSKNVVSGKCLNRFTMEWIDEIAKAIIDLNAITPEEAKN
jgi:uncharacterized protein YcfJ